MTNTANEIEIMICTCCLLIVANDDGSGCDDPETRRANVLELWPGAWNFIITSRGDEDAVDVGLDWNPDMCDRCGALACTDSKLHPALAERLDR